MRFVRWWTGPLMNSKAPFGLAMVLSSPKQKMANKGRVHARDEALGLLKNDVKKTEDVQVVRLGLGKASSAPPPRLQMPFTVSACKAITFLFQQALPASALNPIWSSRIHGKWRKHAASAFYVSVTKGLTGYGLRHPQKQGSFQPLPKRNITPFILSSLQIAGHTDWCIQPYAPLDSGADWPLQYREHISM